MFFLYLCIFKQVWSKWLEKSEWIQKKLQKYSWFVARKQQAKGTDRENAGHQCCVKLLLQNWLQQQWNSVQIIDLSGDQ